MPEDRRQPDFAILAIVYRQPEAAVLMSMLRAYGFAARAPNWYTVTLYPHYTLLLGGIPILVSPSDFDDALALVGDPADLPKPPRTFRCGRGCNIGLAAALLCFMLLFGAILMIPPPRALGSYAAARAAVT